MRRDLIAVFLSLILVTGQPALAKEYEQINPSTLDTLFLPFFSSAIEPDGSMTRDLQSQNAIRTGISNGLGLVTMMKLHDLYNQSVFLEYASQVSDFVATGLTDLRYPLVATYYDTGSDIISNYRAVEDNFLLAWGLDLLANRIDSDDELEVKIQEDRADFLREDLDQFDAELGFHPSIRVDTATSSNLFKVFPNLFAAYLISESQSRVFADFEGKPLEVLEFVRENATNQGGGVYTVVFNGFVDDIVTLKNTALFGNLAMNLYLQTEEQQYLDLANGTYSYIQDNFHDIGKTGGYIETLQDGEPIQQSKSLFSHALLLQLLIKLANLGDQDARLDLLAIWRTITNYFRVSNYFFSTLDRSGSPGSSTIDTVDNLMMMYSMNSLPLITHINFTQRIEFKDKISVDLDLNIPENINSRITVTDQNDATVLERDLTGSSDLQELIIELDPKRPQNEVEAFSYQVKLSSEGVVTDTVDLMVEVSLAPGVDLSIGVITVFSVLAVVIFALFVKRTSEGTPQVQG